MTLVRKKNLFLFLFFSFLGAMALGYFFQPFPEFQTSNRSRSDNFNEKNPIRFRSTSIKTDGNNKLSYSENELSSDLFDFFNTLRTSSDVKTLNRLFDEIFSPAPASGWLSHRNKQVILIQKFAEKAPMQCLDKMEEYKCSSDFLSDFFTGWANKDPSSAIKFYEDHYKNNISHNQSSDITKALVFSYAQNSPHKALEWLLTQENDIPLNTFQEVTDTLLESISWTDPSLLPEFLEKTKAELGTKTAYNAGASWIKNDSEFNDWLNNMPEDSKISAEAGRIARLTQGNLEKIHLSLSHLSPDHRLNIIKELAIHNLYGSDQTGRIKWFLENIPEKEFPEEFVSQVHSWFEKNEEEKEQIINSLSLEKRMEINN